MAGTCSFVMCARQQNPLVFDASKRHTPGPVEAPAPVRGFMPGRLTLTTKLEWFLRQRTAARISLARWMSDFARGAFSGWPGPALGRCFQRVGGVVIMR